MLSQRLFSTLRNETRHLHRLFGKSSSRNQIIGRSNSTKAAADNTSRLPKFLQKYASRLKDKPVSHITSFFILHELTAIIPLPILFWLFHSFDWTPPGIYFSIMRLAYGEALPTEYIEKGARIAGKQLEKWGIKYTGDDGSRYVFEGAAAYAVVKMLLPLRIGISFAMAPWFARRFVIPFTRIFSGRKV